jgi:hypothetical protein
VIDKSIEGIMSCLTTVELQMIADGESSRGPTAEAARTHLAECDRCRTRLAQRRRHMDELVSLADDGGSVSSALEDRLHRALASGRTVRGATALRGPVQPSRLRLELGWVSALAVAAVVALVVFGVLPHLGAPTRLSASEILGRSLQNLVDAHGIELLEYELTVTGLVEGPHRIEQLVDHDHPSRYRFSNHGPDGTLESAISQDPFTGRRSQLIRIDGRNYVFRFTSAKPLISLPQLEEAQIEAVIGMMQATSDPKLSVVDAPDGRQYVIQIPQLTPARGAGMFDVYRARTVIDARDFRIRQFDASGALLKQPYSISFNLIRQAFRQPGDVDPAEFEIPAGPGDVVLEGVATNDLLGDLLGTILREIGRIRSVGALPRTPAQPVAGPHEPHA